MNFVLWGICPAVEGGAGVGTGQCSGGVRRKAKVERGLPEMSRHGDLVGTPALHVKLCPRVPLPGLVLPSSRCLVPFPVSFLLLSPYRSYRVRE